MRNPGVAPLYDRLSPEERFRLALEAQARGDELELDRLRRSTPWKPYRMRDAAVIDLCEAGRETAMTFLLLWHNAHARWLTFLVLERSGIRSEDYLAAVADMSGTFHGLEDVAKTLGLASDTLVRAWLGPSPMSWRVRCLSSLGPTIPSSAHASVKQRPLSHSSSPDPGKARRFGRKLAVDDAGAAALVDCGPVRDLRIRDIACGPKVCFGCW